MCAQIYRKFHDTRCVHIIEVRSHIFKKEKSVRNLSEVRLKIVCAEEKIGIVNSIDTKTLLCICYSSTGSAPRQRPPQATPPARVKPGVVINAIISVIFSPVK